MENLSQNALNLVNSSLIRSCICFNLYIPCSFDFLYLDEDMRYGWICISDFRICLLFFIFYTTKTRFAGSSGVSLRMSVMQGVSPLVLFVCLPAVSQILQRDPHQLVICIDCLVSQLHQKVDGKLGLRGRNRYSMCIIDLPGGKKILFVL